MQGDHYATVVRLHVAVDLRLHWVVVVYHASLRVIHTERKVPGGVADVYQPRRRMKIEPGDENHISSSNLTVGEVGRPQRAFFRTRLLMLEGAKVFRCAESRAHHCSWLTAQVCQRHEISVELVRV